MIEFSEFTNSKGIRVVVNIRSISHFYADTNTDKGCVIYLTNGILLNVRDSYEDVIDSLNLKKLVAMG